MGLGWVVGAWRGLPGASCLPGACWRGLVQRVLHTSVPLALHASAAWHVHLVTACAACLQGNVTRIGQGGRADAKQTTL